MCSPLRLRWRRIIPGGPEWKASKIRSDGKYVAGSNRTSPLQGNERELLHSHRPMTALDGARFRGCAYSLCIDIDPTDPWNGVGQPECPYEGYAWPRSLFGLMGS
jgi:hypothetical protein